MEHEATTDIGVEPTSIDDTQDFPVLPEAGDLIEFVRVSGIPPSVDGEMSIFARHDGIPAHNQDILRDARVLCVGAGGLNSWVLVGLARSGVGTITVLDSDRVDRSNLSRQFYESDDLGLPKGPRLARRIAEQAIGGGDIIGIGLEFEDALEQYPLPADLIIAGVDNNKCRLEVVREARRRGICAVFTMLSPDGMRLHAFLQSGSRLDPCLWCALPNLDPEHLLPCASAIISSCFLAAGFTLFFAHRALMGWGEMRPFNWRSADLSGATPEQIGRVSKRPGCPVCSSL